ncbi:MAG: hypothetical protein IAG10_23365 [Planctomycetaceae bacterium]|nr:hypothetical protein [Planctomycetaceae bacterium]
MMRFELLTMLTLSLGSSFLLGCGEKSAPATSPTVPAANSAAAEDPKIAAAIAKLPEEERVLAAAQKFCAVENKSPLGSMGMPHKILVEGQPVFLCCAGCEEEALKDPQATLAKVEKLKQAATAHP